MYNNKNLKVPLKLPACVQVSINNKYFFGVHNKCNYLIHDILK